MSIDNIIIEDTDSLKETAIKTVLLFAGSSELSKQMKRLKVEYTKVTKGALTKFVLRNREFGRIEVKL